MANGFGDLWMLMTVVGVIVLGAALAYALMKNRGMTRSQKNVAESGTHANYNAENEDPANNR